MKNEASKDGWSPAAILGGIAAVVAALATLVAAFGHKEVPPPKPIGGDSSISLPEQKPPANPPVTPAPAPAASPIDGQWLGTATNGMASATYLLKLSTKPGSDVVSGSARFCSGPVTQIASSSTWDGKLLDIDIGEDVNLVLHKQGDVLTGSYFFPASPFMKAATVTFHRATSCPEDAN